MEQIGERRGKERGRKRRRLLAAGSKEKGEPVALYDYRHDGKKRKEYIDRPRKVNRILLSQHEQDERGEKKTTAGRRRGGGGGVGCVKKRNRKTWSRGGGGGPLRRGGEGEIEGSLASAPYLFVLPFLHVVDQVAVKGKGALGAARGRKYPYLGDELLLSGTTECS